jgi:tRNA(fMet)-specific endonuclease VapC
LVCADSDFITDLDRGKAAAFEKLDELENRGETVYTTAITVAELYHGANNSINVEQATARVEEILDKFLVLDLDYKSAKTWGRLVKQLKSNAIGELDLFIASIALSNKQSLLTRNSRHFERVPGLAVEGW